MEGSDARETLSITERELRRALHYCRATARSCRSPHMYKPNFCSECGAKILSLRWHFWTSRRFCSDCASRLRKARFVPALIATLGLFGTGYIAGRVRRPPSPPLIIERRSDSPLNDAATGRSAIRSTASEAATTPTPTNSPAIVEETVYVCGARTKKGTHC